MKQYTLKVTGMSQHSAGRGRIMVDPQVADMAGWETGQVLEVAYDKKTHARLWPGTIQYGSGLVEMDGATRQNAGAAIGDRVEVRAVRAQDAAEVTVSPTEEIQISGLQEFMAETYNNRVLGVGDVLTVGTQMGARIALTVVSAKPAGPVVVTVRTRFVQGQPRSAVSPAFTYDDLGGLDQEIKKIREMVELPLRHPELFEKAGIEAPKGVLLYGPPGTGKTLLARAVAGETSAHFLHISGPEIMGKYQGESEERMRGIFQEASKNAPSIIFVDEIDSIAPKRDDVHGEVEKRVVSQLLTLMDGLQARGKVVVIAATNRPDSIDPALRRPGRFDREMEIGIPDMKGRHDILRIHTRQMPLDDGVDMDQVARVTHGFVGADLQALCKEAAMGALRRLIPELDLEQDRIPPELLKKIQISAGDFRGALREVRPSALREVMVQVPDVGWDQVGGLDSLKSRIQEAVVWPLKYPDAVSHVGVRPPRGILLYGPPGTGKTLLARALAYETDSNFISIKGPELLSKWVGESERGVREIFRKARQAAPCVIFFDEVDSLAPARGTDTGTHVTENVVSQMLSEMDGLEEMHDVVVVGATNRPDMLDQALLRPGRFDHMVEVPLPDRAARDQILRIHARGKPMEDIDYGMVADMTEGLSGAELRAIIDAAAMAALRRHVEGQRLEDTHITQKDLENSVRVVRKRAPNTKNPADSAFG